MTSGLVGYYYWSLQPSLQQAEVVQAVAAAQLATESTVSEA